MTHTINVEQHEPQCGNCRFFGLRKAQIGDCMAHPPKIIDALIPIYREEMYADGAYAVFMSTFYPQVSEKGWCGEHEPKRPAA